MKLAAVVCASVLCVSGIHAQTVAIGQGSPNEYIRNLFISSYNRGVFPQFANLPPVGAVRRYGSTGLIQEFNDATRSGRSALIKSTAVADADNPYGDVYQLLTDMFAYYSSVGVGTAGYPIQDTQFCPNMPCEYQTFDRRYVLFAYSAGANDPQNITLRDPFYTRWLYFGGIAAFGPAVTAEADVTGSFTGNARSQTFRDGVLYNITTGNLAGRMVSVRQPIFALYQLRGMHTGTLGYPTGDETTLPDGRKRQVFEGGTVEYDANSGPVLRSPVRLVVVRPSTTPVRLNLGESVALEAVVYGSDDQVLPDRPVAFTTTNGRVISIQANGNRATVRAIGGGVARVSATSETKVSVPIEFIVNAPCCAIGEGAPTLGIQQAFQDAATRNRLQVRLPGPERVRREASGYTQEFQLLDGSPARVLIAMGDKLAQAFVLSGALLVKYEQIGGPASFLGYPTSDASAGGGHQLFEGGALGGTPLHVVSGAILARWAMTGFETGPPGSPVGESAAVTTFTGTAGHAQSFRNGLLAGSSKAAYFVSGLIADQYLATGGPAGPLGFPAGEEVGLGGVRRQEFEGGRIEYAPGDAAAKAIIEARSPAIAAAPTAVLPGARVRLTVSGFAAGAVVRVSVTGQPDFLVPMPTGSHTWETAIPATATPGTVRVRAVDESNAAQSAEATYSIRALGQIRVQMAKTAGDTQTGLPGTVLALPLQVSVKDDGGNPISGLSVRFTAMPGAQVIPETVTTNAAGFAETRLKLPPFDGVALVTAEAARQVVTFSARSAGSAISSFPRLKQSGTDNLGHGSSTVADSGALLVSAASIIRYYQIRGDLPQPNGLADAGTLNEFLKKTCITDRNGAQSCDGFLSTSQGDEQIVNLWRLPAFAGGGMTISVEPPDTAQVRSLVAAGTPVLLALTMSANDRVAGSHFVVATAASADGSIGIHDPSTTFDRTRLEDYTAGFAWNGQQWKGAITGAIRFVPRTTQRTGFVLSSSTSALSVASRAGECGIAVEWPETPVKPGSYALEAGRILRQRACDGLAEEYQIELLGQGELRGVVTDLAESGARTEIAGSRSAAFRATRPGVALLIEPQESTLLEHAVVNAATFTADIAPGGLVSIFGSGLAHGGTTTKVEVGGRPAAVIAALPFQVNAQIPPETVSGSHVLRVETPYGMVDTLIDVQLVAPAVFRVGAGRGAVVNQDGRLNGVESPARRGETIVVYGTGLGATVREGSLSRVVTPVTASLRGQEVRVSYAGLTPGFTGLYQVNIVIPITFSPGLAMPLTLRQGGVDAEPVEISIQ